MHPERSEPEKVRAEQQPILDETRRPESPLVEAECAWCGLVTVAIEELGCSISDTEERGLCQFACPLCQRLATREVSLLEIKTLIVAGARALLHAPLELIEPKSGAAISWDDVLDFSLELATAERR